ncbi:MAG: SPFH domain-containing protein [Lachnospiraceae bacterium]|nr:SPFH domain-containing protein [Lachnospiraceae bacterium]
MGIIKAFSGAVSGSFSDQWRDIITVEPFTETEVIKLGTFINQNNGRGSNTNSSEGVITNGSKIFVPENTLAIIFDSSGIEGIITEPGGFEYHNGEKSLLSNDGFMESIVRSINSRFDFGGQPSSYKKILFMNLREIRNIKFGTRGPLLYHDLFYDVDLEIIAHGTFSIQIIKPATFIQNFLPPNCEYYDLSNFEASEIIRAELIQSLGASLNRLSKEIRTSDLPSHISDITKTINEDVLNVGAWKEKYGFELSSIYINNIQFSSDSRELVKQFSANKMNVDAYGATSKKASDIAFMQNVGQGVKANGLGDAAGFMMGMNLFENMKSDKAELAFDNQVEMVKKLKELLDIGAISEAEFDIKKRDILGL